MIQSSALCVGFREERLAALLLLLKLRCKRAGKKELLSEDKKWLPFPSLSFLLFSLFPSSFFLDHFQR